MIFLREIKKVYFNLLEVDKQEIFYSLHFFNLIYFEPVLKAIYL